MTDEGAICGDGMSKKKKTIKLKTIGYKKMCVKRLEKSKARYKKIEMSTFVKTNVVHEKNGQDIEGRS